MTFGSSNRPPLIHQADVMEGIDNLRLAFNVLKRPDIEPTLTRDFVAAMSLAEHVIGNSERPRTAALQQWIDAQSRDNALDVARMVTDDLIAAPYIGAELKAALETFRPHIR